jgi:hypothetical protein
MNSRAGDVQNQDRSFTSTCSKPLTPASGNLHRYFGCRFVFDWECDNQSRGGRWSGVLARFKWWGGHQNHAQKVAAEQPTPATPANWLLPERGSPLSFAGEKKGSRARRGTRDPVPPYSKNLPRSGENRHCVFNRNTIRNWGIPLRTSPGTSPAGESIEEDSRPLCGNLPICPKKGPRFRSDGIHCDDANQFQLARESCINAKCGTRRGPGWCHARKPGSFVSVLPHLRNSPWQKASPIPTSV